VTNVVERQVVVTNVVDRPVVVTNVVERQVVVTNVVDRPVVVTNVVERQVVVEKPVEKRVFVTNVVEKLVVDREKEAELKRVNARLERMNTDLAQENAKLELSGGKVLSDLEGKNRELERKLAAAEDRSARLARVAPQGSVQQLTGRPANITSSQTYYDRKGGFAIFSGKVHVDDEQYQMHANKAFVFFGETNQLKRLVAQGNVAITNDTKRAYGTKVLYYRDNGMVVLQGDDACPATVVDVSKVQDQSVRGRKIRFWINQEQVEVLDASIAAPRSGMGGALPGLRP